MAFFTTLAAVASVVSIGLGVKSYKDQKKANKAQTRAQDKQFTTASEAAKLRSTSAESGARVKIGSKEATEDPTKSTTTSIKRKASGSTVGGVSASSIGGL